jgi:hypothetical protein
MDKKFSCLVNFVISLAFVVGVEPTAFGNDFYSGKTIHFFVGYAPGGGYDITTRAVARHMSRHISGNPTIIVTNMTGAGSLVAANYTYNKAKPDGLNVGVWNSAFVLLQALGDRGVKLDARKLGWIGAPTKGTPACGIMGFTGLKTLDDILNSKNPILMGATRAGVAFSDVPKILNKYLGTKFKVIEGYTGSAKIRLAMAAREVHGACWPWESIRTTARAMLDADGAAKLVPFVIHRRWQDPEVRNLPLIPELIKARGGDEGIAVYRAWSGQYEFQRPFVTPPGVPKARLDILRKAFKATLEDPKFLAETKRSKLLTEYVSPEEIQRHISQTLSMPPKAKENLHFLVRKKSKKT